MKLRNNRGISTVDATIAITIILIFIPTIFSFGYNIQTTNTAIKREARSIEMATDVLEIVKSMKFEDINLNNDDLKNNLESHNYRNVISGEYEATGRNDEIYKINITVKENYPGYVKTVKVSVSYIIRKETKQITINTVIKNDNINIEPTYKNI